MGRQERRENGKGNAKRMNYCQIMTRITEKAFFVDDEEKAYMPLRRQRRKKKSTKFRRARDARKGLYGISSLFFAVAEISRRKGLYGFASSTKKRRIPISSTTQEKAYMALRRRRRKGLFIYK